MYGICQKFEQTVHAVLYVNTHNHYHRTVYTVQTSICSFGFQNLMFYFRFIRFKAINWFFFNQKLESPAQFGFKWNQIEGKWKPKSSNFPIQRIVLSLCLFHFAACLKIVRFFLFHFVTFSTLGLITRRYQNYKQQYQFFFWTNETRKIIYYLKLWVKFVKITRVN